MAADGLLSQADFAELVGVSSRTVFNLRKQGLDEHCEVKGNVVRVRVPDGVHWYIRHKAAEAADTKAPSSLDEAELELAQLKVEEKRLEVGKKRGELIEVAALEPWVGDMMARMGSRLDALPLRIAQTVNGKTLAARRKQAEDLVGEVREEIRLGPLGGTLEEAA
jgi:phage terminase Nu1 subunit (DNA packaging protein)